MKSIPSAGIINDNKINKIIVRYHGGVTYALCRRNDEVTGPAMKVQTKVAAAALVVFAWCALAPAWAQSSIGVSRSPDTKTHFVWTGSERKENQDKTLFLIFENGGQKTGTSVSSGKIDVTFARAETEKIKWCNYVGTDLDMKKCNPSQALKPGGTINIK